MRWWLRERYDVQARKRVEGNLAVDKYKGWKNEREGGHSNFDLGRRFGNSLKQNLK